MEQQPYNPHDRDIPDRERLDPWEIDLTGTVKQPGKLRDVIYDAISEADHAKSDIPGWGARAIARELANQLPAVPGPLHHYAVTGSIDHASLARELATHVKSDNDEIRELADLLGLYLIKQPAGRPTPTGTESLGDTTVERGLREDGAPFWAYLQLSDTQARSDELLTNFHDFYIGSFATMRDLLDALTDRRQGMEAVNKAAEEWGLEEFVNLNEAALSEAARTAWDIVEFHGKLHVFMK